MRQMTHPTVAEKPGFLISAVKPRFFQQDYAVRQVTHPTATEKPGFLISAVKPRFLISRLPDGLSPTGIYMRPPFPMLL